MICNLYFKERYRLEVPVPGCSLHKQERNCLAITGTTKALSNFLKCSGRKLNLKKLYLQRSLYIGWDKVN